MWLYLYQYDIKLVDWKAMVWKIFKFSSFISIALIIWLSVFYILYYIDLLTGFPFTHFSFPISILLGLPLSNTRNWSVSPAIGGIIISIILLIYLMSFFLVLRCVKTLVCYNLIIWYEGGVKNGLIKNGYLQYLMKLGFFLIGNIYWEGGSTIQF